ncbi:MULTISPECIES: hypothetical protein [Paenibacillus]|uniref:hypothetical protein n=1 Tax=Paenibacillus TaxID=44249 RepID=UPI00087EC7FD|nr:MULTISPECIES: hypothetical protein [Paenibacillus]SDD49463.1 hypothetical protein SAMN05428987_4974 [Paenibacillus sp. CF095]
MSKKINEISDYVGVFCLGALTLSLFVLSIMFIIKSFINIYRRLKGVKIDRMTPCTTCRRSISNTAIICPYCGEHYGKMNGLGDSIFICFLFGVGLFVLGIASLTESVEWFERTYMN